VLQAQVDSLTIQLRNARSSASRPSNNTQHGPVRSAVLNDEKLKEGFNKNVWAPPEEDNSESDSEPPKEPAVVGFNKAAWTPPNEEDT
jgi:hypothetical protein